MEGWKGLEGGKTAEMEGIGVIGGPEGRQD